MKGLVSKNSGGAEQTLGKTRLDEIIGKDAAECVGKLQSRL